MNNRGNQDARQCKPRAEVRTFPNNSSFDDYPTIREPHAFRDFFEREGFICIREAVPRTLCEQAKNAFLAEVLPDKRRFFLRHESGRMERHVLTEHGFMKYPIMNIQDISARHFASFKQAGLEILTHPVIQRGVQAILNEPGHLIHTMYFDGNQVTWAHRDGHYLDAAQAGGMLGIWVAVEDIQPGAGRFYIIPRSHRMAVPGEQQDPNGVAYKAMMADFVRNGPLECVAPLLCQGDVLIWSSLTLHGSLPTTTPEFSRRSLTAHYIPCSQPFAWRDGSASSRLIHVNGVAVTLHGDQHSFMKNLGHSIEAVSPRLGLFLRQARHQLRQWRGHR